MNLSCLVVHHQISDEAAAHLCELLNDLAFAFDGQSFAQVRRSYHERRDSERSCHTAQLDRFDDDDVTFSITRRTHQRAGDLTVTTSTVIIAVVAVPVNAGARSALAPLSDDGGAM